MMRRSSARLLVISLLMLLLVGAAAFALGNRNNRADVSPRAKKPQLMLLTTLPLMFSEDFSLDGGGSKALSSLETRYVVVPIGTTDAASLQQGRLLLLAHPLAQPAESLVELDRWVRRGGRVLLLADPRLEWPSKLPLGDKLRPPPSFADTGLLAHWGLRLDPPASIGAKELQLGHRKILALSPGKLAGSCRISSDGFVAHCDIEKGRATVIADADFLNVERLGGRSDQNLDALLAELARLE